MKPAFFYDVPREFDILLRRIRSAFLAPAGEESRLAWRLLALDLRRQWPMSADVAELATMLEGNKRDQGGRPRKSELHAVVRKVYAVYRSERTNPGPKMTDDAIFSVMVAIDWRDHERERQERDELTGETRDALRNGTFEVLRRYRKLTKENIARIVQRGRTKGARS